MWAWWGKQFHEPKCGSGHVCRVMAWTRQQGLVPYIGSFCSVTLRTKVQSVVSPLRKHEASALKLVGSTGYSLFWALQIDQKHQGRSLLTTIDAFEANIEEKTATIQRYDKVILQHDNVSPHVVKRVKTNLKTLKWKVLLHSHYSANISPSDYHLFKSMAHGLT